MDQRTRMDKLTQFKNGQYHTLIATDVAARGIHVDGITHVVNFFVPFDNENYVHRIGRTGRVDANGIAITLVTESENERFIALEKFLGYEIPCLGGHVQRKISKKELNKRKSRYKAENSRCSTVEINSGRSNSRLKVKDIISAFSSVSGVYQGDIGKVEIRDKVTFVEIKNGKEDDIIKTFRTAKIRDKRYRVKHK
jgi:superfamily II DNA/RNA helicase